MTRQRNQRGAAAVEFAIVVPLFLLLVFGIAEFGRAWFTVATLNGAAREGSRTMAITSDAVKAKTAVKNAAGPLNVQDGQIAFKFVNPNGTEVAACSATVVTTATITYPYVFLGALGSMIKLVGGSGSNPVFPPDLKGTASFRCYG